MSKKKKKTIEKERGKERDLLFTQIASCEGDVSLTLRVSSFAC